MEHDDEIDKLDYRDYARFAAMTLEQIERDCSLDVFRASGPGGQGVNTTDSAVRLTHIPTGIAVTSRESRSQFRNRQLCLQKLRDLFERRAVPPQVRHKTKVSRAAKERRLKGKRIVSRKKTLRKKDFDDE